MASESTKLSYSDTIESQLSFEIRPMTQEDFPEIKKVFESNVPKFFSEDEVRKVGEDLQYIIDVAKPSHAQGFVATQGKNVLGYVGYVSEDRDTYWIDWMSVHKKERSAGIGSALVSTLEDTVKSYGAKELFVDTSTTPEYTPTRGFYAKHLFFPSERELEERPENNITLVKTLEDSPVAQARSFLAEAD